MKADRAATFRVHFADGGKMVVDAANPDEARKTAQKARSGIITKVKALRGTVERRDG